MFTSTVFVNILFPEISISSKGRATKKNKTSQLLNMYYLYGYKYVCAETQLIPLKNLIDCTTF